MYLSENIAGLSNGAPRAGWGAALAVLFLPVAALAGEWTIVPSLEVEQSVTDNARSVAEGQEADLITTTTGGINVSGQGRRAQLSFNYNLSRDSFWDNTELSGMRQNLLGAGNLEAWEDHIFIDTRASISQQSLVRNGGTSASERTVATNDQSTVVNYSVTPNFAHRYGNWADTDLRYTFNETRFLDTDTGSAGAQPDASRSQTVVALLRSGTEFNRLSWELSTTRTFTDNGSDSNLMQLSSEYVFSRKLTLIGLLGREEIENSGLNANDDPEVFWRGGFRLTPGPRTSIRFEAGHRFGGANFSGDASYRLGATTVITASYEEDVRTDRQALTDNLNNIGLDENGQFIDLVTGLPANPNALSFDFLDQTTRQQNFNISINGTSGRNTFSLSASASKRTQEPTDVSDSEVSFGARINRRIWPDLDGGLSANVSMITEAADGNNGLTLRSGAFLNYKIMKQLNGTFRYDFLRRDADNDAQELEENVVSVSLRKTF